MFSTFAIFMVTFVTVQPAAVSRSSPSELILSQTSWAPNCPSGAGKIPRLIPHPYDCTIMFLCSKGVPKVYSCPRDHVFSAELQKCLKSKICKRDSAKKWPAFENCPEDGSEEYFPHPEDCSMFYQCEPPGLAFPKRCPGKLHFNTKEKKCDWPWRANCKSVDSENCPEDGSDHYFPHPENCSMFYQCGPLGVAFLKHCPANLHFNPKEKVCDWPWKANCKSTDSLNCPDDGKNHYFLHEEDCSKFYQCEPSGVAVLKHCPANLHFNLKLKRCDWPRNVDCKSI